MTMIAEKLRGPTRCSKKHGNPYQLHIKKLLIFDWLLVSERVTAKAV
jgi:hypothetical protein